MFGQIQGMATSDSVSCQLNFTVRKLLGSLNRFSAPLLPNTQELRERRIVCPPLPAIERLAGSVRARAQRQLWRRLADGLTDQQRQSLDKLLEVRVGGGQSTLAWLRQTAYAATTGNFPKLIERLTLVRALGVEPERATRVHQNHWLNGMFFATKSHSKTPFCSHLGSDQERNVFR
jgi:hypothetical protein